MAYFFNQDILLIPGMSTALLHGVMGILSASLSIIFFISYKLKMSSVSKKLTLFFLSFTAYSTLVALPIIFYPGNMIFASWGMLLGFYFILLVIMLGFDTPLFYNNRFFEKNAKKIRIIFPILWGLLSLYALLFPTLPEVGAGNFVYWNFPTITAWGIGALTFLGAILWGYIYSTGSTYVDRGRTEEFIKTGTFAIDGILWSIAGPLYFIAPGFWAIMTAFIIMIITFISTALIFTYFHIKKTPSQIQEN